MFLYIDIETVPTSRTDVYERLVAEERDAAMHDDPPANYKREEAIRKWRQQRMADADALATKRHRDTALEGGYGHVVCVCWAIDDGPIQTRDIDDTRDEPSLLVDLWTALRQQVGQQRAVWVGHYIEFDLRFLWQRSVVTGYRPSVHIPYNAAPYRGDYIDTMWTWAGNRGSVKLKTLCDMLQIATSDNDIDGSGVYDAWLARRHDDIRTHCELDVMRVREIHKRMRFEPDDDQHGAMLA